MKKISFLFFTLVLHLQTSVWAMAAQPQPGGEEPPAWVTWIPLLVLVFIMYVFIIRPQSRRQKDHQNMIENLKKGDKVITQGGLHATIVNVGPQHFDIKLNEDTKVKIQKTSIVDVVVDKPTPNGKVSLVQK